MPPKDALSPPKDILSSLKVLKEWPDWRLNPRPSRYIPHTLTIELSGCYVLGYSCTLTELYALGEQVYILTDIINPTSIKLTISKLECTLASIYQV